MTYSTYYTISKQIKLKVKKMQYLLNNIKLNAHHYIQSILKSTFSKINITEKKRKEAKRSFDFGK